MKKKSYGLMTAALLLALSAMAPEAKAFTLTGTNFTGFHAWDKGGDVVGTFGLDPRFNFANTGQYFNFAAGFMFDVTYSPITPTLDDIHDNPSTDYLWSLSVQNATLPWGGNPFGFELKGIASGNDFMAGGQWFKNIVTPHLPKDLCFAFDLNFFSPTQAKASIGLAGNIDPTCLPWWTPAEFYCPWQSNASVTISASSIPGNEPVPEPLTMILFGTGLAGLGIVRKVKGMNV